MSGRLVLVLPGGEREVLEGVDFGWHLKRLHEHIASAHPEGQQWSANLLRLATVSNDALELAATEEGHAAGRIQDRLPGHRRFDERSLTDRELQEGDEVWVHFAQPSDPTTVLHQIQQCGVGIHWGWACGQCPITCIEWHENDLKRNKEVVMAAVLKNAGTFHYADLKGDYDIVMEAVRQDRHNLRCASESLKSNREIILAAGSLEYASKQLRADRQIVSAAVNRDPNELQYASDELRADRALVAAAVQICGMALQHASGSLRADRAIVMRALWTHNMLTHPMPYANPFYYAATELQADPSVAIQALSSELHGRNVYSRLVDNALDHLWTTRLDLAVGCLWRLQAVRTVLTGTHDPASPLRRLRGQCGMLEQILMRVPQVALEALLVAPALRQAIGARADQFVQSYTNRLEQEAAAAVTTVTTHNEGCDSGPGGLFDDDY